MRAFPKRLLTMLLSAAMVFGLSGMSAFAAEEDSSGGDISTYVEGVQPELNTDGYYEIATDANLVWFAEQVNAGNNSINGIVTADGISVSDSDGFSPIGSNASSSARYAGTFDGNGHSIEVNINNTADKYQALFGYTNGATISDLTVTGSVTGAQQYVAGLVAYMSGGTLTGCVNEVTVTNTATSNYSYTGGLVGYFVTSSTSSIDNCGNDGAITASTTIVGGIAGDAYGTGNYAPRISGCYNHAAIEGGSRVGGIVGYSETNATQIYIDSCYNTGTITSTTNSGANGQLSGGLLGVFTGGTSNMNVVSNSYNAGDVIYSTSSAVGALIGGNNSSYTQITLDHAYYRDESAESYYATSGTESITVANDNDGNPTVASKSADEMKELDFLDLINANLAFTQGTDHPILKWETDDRSPYMLLKEEYDEDLTLDWADYTTESWEAFTAVLEEAGALLESPNASDDALTAMLKKLQDAKKDLEYIEPDYTLKYAVSIYDINKDVDEDGHTLGLTFGPATGPESYVRSYKAHLTEEEYEADEDAVCIHWMSWREIVRQCKEDPEAFRDCLNNGCTTAVKVNLNDTLADPDYDFVRMIGDGCGIFYYSLKSTYMQANFQGNQHNYSEMTWRTTLNSDSYGLITCFPEDLQRGMAARKVDYAETAGSSTTLYLYDKMWIVSLAELSSYYRPGSSNVNNSPDNRTYKYWNCYETGEWGSWSTRTHYQSYDKSLTSIYYNSIEGTYGTVNGGTVGGLSPLFCLAGPEENQEMSAFAVYSADDGSLTFYTDYDVPAKGDMYGDKAVTEVYTDVDETAAASAADIPWSDVCTDVTDVVIDQTFADAQPNSFAYWFDGFENAAFTGLNYMDLTDVTDVSNMFHGCASLTGLDLSEWDTTGVTGREQFATGCPDLEWVTIGENTDIFSKNQNVDQQEWYDNPINGSLVSSDYLQDVTEPGQYWSYTGADQPAHTHDWDVEWTWNGLPLYCTTDNPDFEPLKVTAIRPWNVVESRSIVTLADDEITATAVGTCTICKGKETVKAKITSEYLSDPPTEYVGALTELTATATFSDGQTATDSVKKIDAATGNLEVTYLRGDETVTTDSVPYSDITALIDKTEPFAVHYIASGGVDTYLTMPFVSITDALGIGEDESFCYFYAYGEDDFDAMIPADGYLYQRNKEDNTNHAYYYRTAVTINDDRPTVRSSQTYVSYVVRIDVQYMHQWGTPEWTWSDDYSSATVTASCTRDNGQGMVVCNHTDTAKATINETTQDGYIVYTATATLDDGTVVTDVQRVEVTPPKETYSVTTEYTNLTGTGETGEDAATAGEDYVTTLTANDGYTLPESVEVTIGGSAASAGTDYTYSAQTGELTIYGAAITGNIVITAEAEVDEEYYVVKYAVCVWGIEQDTGAGGENFPLGLTFGPVTGEKYNKTYVSRETVGEEAHPSEYCIHDMTWEEIIDQNKQDPTVFHDCLVNGCTKTVDIDLTGKKLLADDYTKSGMTGEGTGVLYNSIDPTYRRWNSERDNTGGWPSSYIRATLNGYDDLTDTDGVAAGALSAEDSLFSCLPEVLQEGITAKAVKSDTVSSDTTGNNETTYDNLWLFSTRETFGANYASRTRQNEGALYEKPSLLPIDGTSASKEPLITYDENGVSCSRWSRSLWNSSSYPTTYVSSMSNGDSGNFADAETNGISFGFCLSAVEREPANTKQLGRLYNDCIEYDPNDYTAASWEPFEKALEAAKEILDKYDENNLSVTQDEVDAAYEALLEAEENLQRKGEAPEAFAVYSEDDSSLTFAYDAVPAEGSTYDDKEVTAVYTGLETLDLDYTNKANDLPWYDIREDVTSVVIDESFTAAQPISLAFWFYEFSNATFSGLENMDTSKVESMSGTFYYCTSLESVDGLANWDTSSVEYMDCMFSECESLENVDALADWDTAKNTSLNSTFYDCQALTSVDVLNWDTSSVKDMSLMFAECVSLTTVDLSKWNTEKVTNMECMFQMYEHSEAGISAALTSVNLSNWKTSKVSKMDEMFDSCVNLTSVDGLSGLDTSAVVDMRYMFYDCESLESVDVSKWSTKNVEYMNGMFYTCESLTSVDVSNWKTTNLTEMDYAFYGCESLTDLDVSNWKTSYVTEMDYAFYGCDSLAWIKIGDSFDLFAKSSSKLVSQQYWYDSDVDGTLMSDNYMIGVTNANTGNTEGQYWTHTTATEPTVSGVTITAKGSGLSDNTKTYDGEGVILTVSATTTPTDAQVTYQWYYKAAESGEYEALDGAVDSELQIDGDVSDSGTYKCVVTAKNGELTATGSDEITITIEKAAQDISYAVTSVEKYDYDEPFINELTKGDAVYGEITYSIMKDDTLSGDLEVEIDEKTGEVTIHGGSGIVYIVATAAETDNYAETSVRYMLTVNADEIKWEIGSDHGQVEWDDTEDEYIDDMTYTGEPVELTLSLTLTNEEKAELEGITYQWYRYTDTGKLEEIEDANGQTLTLEDEYVNAGDYTYVCMAVVSYHSGYTHTLYCPIEVTIAKAAQELSFEQSEVTKTLGDADFTNELTGAADGATVKYESNNTDVATVAENGEVTIVGAGEATITATAGETANYEEASAFYTLTVTEPEPEPAAVDKDVLAAAIGDAEALDADNYTEDTWSTLLEALENAQAVYESDDVTQSDVDEATIALVAALANLKGVGTEPAATDKTDLLKAYTEAMGLSESDYTPESWDVFAQARKAAQDVLTDPDATQEAVDSAKDALQEAMEGLKPVEQPTSEPKNGLYMIEKGKLWGYYVDDVVDTDYTGFASNENGDWYVVNGYIRFDQNTVAKDLTGKDGDKGVAEKGTWWYVVGNKVQHDFTGLAHYRNENGWWYIVNGRVDFTHNGVDKNQNGWWYVTGGKVQFGFTGLAHYKNANGWWYISAGKVRFDYTGIASNQNGTWYIRNSKVQFDYTGTVRAGGRTYNVTNGRVR